MDEKTERKLRKLLRNVISTQDDVTSLNERLEYGEEFEFAKRRRSAAIDDVVRFVDNLLEC